MRLLSRGLLATPNTLNLKLSVYTYVVDVNYQKTLNQKPWKIAQEKPAPAPAPPVVQVVEEHTIDLTER